MDSRSNNNWVEPSLTRMLRDLKPGESIVTHYFDRGVKAIAHSAGLKISTKTIVAVEPKGRGEEEAYRLTIATKEE